MELLNSIPRTTSFPDCQTLLKYRYLVMLLRTVQPKNCRVNETRYLFEPTTDNILLFGLSSDTAMEGGRFFHEFWSTLMILTRLFLNWTTRNSYQNLFCHNYRWIITPVGCGAPGLDLSRGCFTNGQKFAGISRKIHSETLFVCTAKKSVLTT